VDGLFDGSGVADVEAHGVRPPAGCAHDLDRRFRLVPVGNVVHDHRRAVRGEASDDAVADPARPPGDDRDLAGQLTAHASAFSAAARPGASPTGSTARSGTIRLINPDSTRPGPTSRTATGACAAIARAVASHRTGAVT